MIKLHYYLDKRASGSGPAPLKLAVCKRSQTAFFSTGISVLPEEWDAKTQTVIKSPRRKVMNSHLARLLVTVEDYISPYIYNGTLANLTATEIRNMISAHILGDSAPRPQICDIFLYPIDNYKGNTLQVHSSAGVRCRECLGSLWNVSVDRIDQKWIDAATDKFKEAGYSKNTITTTFIRIRAAWRYSVSKGILSGDPFEKMRLTYVHSRRRNLSIKDMNYFMTAPCKTRAEEFAMDFFKLSFYLLGMNSCDIAKATFSDIYNNRLLYDRSKTDKPYTVLLQPEALEIINKRCDDTHLFAHSYKDLRSLETSVTVALYNRSKRLGMTEKVTMYWARHTWSTLVLDLGYPIEVVSAGLGHSYGPRITEGYAEVKQRRIDEANRAVIDYVLNYKDEQ